MNKRAPKATRSPKSKRASKTVKPKGTRSGSKAEKVLELMKRKEGATLAEIAKANRMSDNGSYVAVFSRGSPSSIAHLS